MWRAWGSKQGFCASGSDSTSSCQNDKILTVTHLDKNIWTINFVWTEKPNAWPSQPFVSCDIQTPCHSEDHQFLLLILILNDFGCFYSTDQAAAKQDRIETSLCDNLQESCLSCSGCGVCTFPFSTFSLKLAWWLPGTQVPMHLII